MPRMSKSEKMLKQQEELEKRQAQEWEEFKVDYHKRLMFLVYEFSSRSVFNVNRSSGVSFSFSARQAEKMYGYPFSKLEVFLPFDLHDCGELVNRVNLMNDMSNLESMVDYLVSLEEEAERKAALKNKDLNKLTQEEREVLGF